MRISEASETKSRVYGFGPFRLECGNALLLLNGHPVAIPPRAFAVLQLLVEREGDLVTKEELIAEVWNGAFIEESNITKSIAEVRRILKVGFRDTDPIRTVWKQGYRFEIPVEVIRQETGEAPVLVAALRQAAVPAPLAAELPAVTGPLRTFRWRVALMSVGLLAGVYVLLHAGGMPSAGGRKIGVLGIRNISGTTSADWLNTALTEMLTSELQAGGRGTASAEEVARMRSDLGYVMNTGYDTAALKKVRLNLGCQLAVTGTFLESGGALRLDLHVQDTETGETRAAISETGTVAELFTLVSRAGGDLRRALGQPAPGGLPAPEPSVNAEAMRLYAQGLERLRE
ncbi:MAG TPA: winged helix-turn-helix domain-containing protein, partial [Candidatus Solibacter sp.]|nr:winged helix-turn-helix domain-containing protein [Candidatus Solibacter sp.]